MGGIFKQGKWIWLRKSGINQYADFVCKFYAENTEGLTLRVSADTDYAVYVNGKFVYAGQYPDYPHYKIYDDLPLSAYCGAGENRLAILCRYAGEDSSTYYRAEAGLIFEVLQNGKVLAASGEATRSREDKGYLSGETEFITPQLGRTFYYDACTDDGWIFEDAEGFCESVPVPKACSFEPRPVPRLKISESLRAEICAQGEYIAGTRSACAAEQIARAFLSYKELPEGAPRALPCGGVPMETSSDGVWFIADMREETAGFVVLELEVPCDAQIRVGFGEHLRDLRVRTRIGPRNFAFGFKAKRGRNRFYGALRRLGGRYLQVLAEAPGAVVYDCRILPAEYPVRETPVRAGDGLRRKIYENGVRTLKTCMHEHYEDCPWREQALYAMDSRNQMLFGAYAFENNEDYVRANLRLMRHGARKDGLLELCFPARVGITIPSFSLYYVFAVAEYFERTGDLAFVRETYPCLENILRAFSSRKDGTGLIPIFTEREYWNFYEWRDGLDGRYVFRDFDLPLSYDSCLNLLYLIALQKMLPVCRALGREGAEREIAELKRAVVRNFYMEKEGAFAASLKDGAAEGLPALAQALAVSADCLPEKAGELCGLLKSGEGLVPVTLANKVWLYEALLKTSEKNLPFVLRDIENVFGKMAACGDTTLYETERGADDFGGAGSLCHGWSAVACYIYRRYEREIGAR